MHLGNGVSDCLYYSFPTKEESEVDQYQHISLDTLLSENLRIKNIPKQRPPVISNKPIFKVFKSNSNGTSSHKSALEEIFEDCQRKMLEYELKLPFTDLAETKSVLREHREENALKNLDISKKSRKLREEIRYQPLSSIVKVECNTPQLNKTIFFSSNIVTDTRAPEEVQYALPTSSPKSDLHRASTPVSRKLQKIDRYGILETSLKNPPFEMYNENKLEYEASHSCDTEYDPLACHAGNIMRMAVDSTMLGSSYNESFPSSYGNTFAGDESTPSKGARRKDYDANQDDKSLIECLKGSWNSRLLKEKAVKIDINENDLNEAIRSEVM